MKKVVKVSIGNLAFTVEEEGFLLIKGYLDELHDYYDSNVNGDEIIEGIEERMAELFTEKSGVASVVTTAVIRDVITILGRPEVIVEEQSEYSRTSTGSGRRVTPKRLYRNPDNKVLGGVCSGIAAYTSMDVSLIRILYVVIFIGFSFLGIIFSGGVPFMIIAYIILWIVIPEAKTVEQRCAMYGEPMDLSNIERDLERGARKIGKGIRRASREGAEVMSGFARVLSKAVSIFLITVSLIAITALSFLFLGIEVFKGIIPIDLMDYVALGIENTLYLKLAFLGVMFLPLFGMLYGGVQLLFGFRPPRIRPGLIIFLLWLLSLLSFGFLAVKSSRPFWDEESASAEKALTISSDTIYIKFASATPPPHSRIMLEAGYSNYTLFWMDEDELGSNIVLFPELKIVRQSASEVSRIRYRTRAYGHDYTESMLKARNTLPGFEIQDSLITIGSAVYSKQDKWDGTTQNITLYIPEGVQVVVKEPFEHDFKSKNRKEWFFNNKDFMRKDWERHVYRSRNWRDRVDRRLEDAFDR